MGSSGKLWNLLWLICASEIVRVADTSIKLTNIECKAFDKDFADFSSCRLSVAKRGVIALNLHVRLKKLPVDNMTLNLSLWKKASGYRPFLYNTTTDFCAFMTNRKRFPFLKIFMDVLTKDSNLNHTCPYNHDIIVKNLLVEDRMFALMPVPFGDYMFRMMVGAYNDWKVDVKAYATFTLKDD